AERAGAVIALLLAPLVLWHSYRGAEEEALRRLLQGFGEVQSLAVPYDAFASKLTAAIPGGNGPDLFIFAHERAGAWAHEGYLAEVPEPLEVDSAARDALMVDGKLYGYPLAYKTVALYYNRKLAGKAPQTP